MRTLLFTLSAALALLGGCSQTATMDNSAGNASKADAVDPDITEVPDESADANGAAADMDDGNEIDDSQGGTGYLNDTADMANTVR